MGEPWLRSAALFWTALLSFNAPSYGANVVNEYRITGPLLHDNLTLFLVHGQSAPGPVPMTLEEALQKQQVRVSEVGHVNELAIENFGDREVFIQSGDIVTGGKQDRVIVSSLVLPPRSGKLNLAVFCVESGRWSPREGTQDGHFVAAAAAMPSPRARTILYEAAAAPPQSGQPVNTSNLQSKMWATAASVQADLSRELRTNASDPASPTSLALSLDMGKLKEAQKGFVHELEPAGLKEDDVLGFVLVVNGRVTKANIYASNKLFRAMWPKQLRAAAAEAIQDRTTGEAASPSTQEISKLLDLATFGEPVEKKVTASVVEVTRETSKMVFAETRRIDKSWVLRSYLAKAL
jgi:hypothetical protein